ncbi:restriction endonuclease subunit S [Fredinandcohnia sp. 179-A 10B2 NHS]|uniref:restriction endonuclease subunit S n=1 Tax=Fredinandcohnia sp. 179-A 10B2 NHS TaxID=3235176 RepID=UPI0039A2B984
MTSKNVVTLGELIDIKHGYAFKGVNFSKEETNLILLTPGNFKIGGGFLNNKFKYHLENADFPHDFILNTGDLLVTMTDLSKDGDTLGYPALVPKIEGKLLLHNQRLGKISIKDESKITKPYLYYLLCSSKYRHHILATATGTTVKHTAPDRIKSYKFELPDIEEQNRVAGILSGLDEKIELNNEMNVTLEDIAQGIYKRWFVDFNFPNDFGKPYKISDGKFIESEMGVIPSSFKEGKLESIAIISTKSIKPQENPHVLFEHYSIPAYDDQRYPVSEYGIEIKSNKYRVETNSFLVSKLNPTTKRVWEPLCLTEYSISSTEFINFKPKDLIYSSYLYSVLNSAQFSEHLIKHATGSTGSRQRVKPLDTLSYKILLPNEYILRAFDDIVGPIREQLKENKKNNQVLKKLRDNLLLKLIEGKSLISDII